MKQSQIRVINFVLIALLAFIALLFVVQASAETMPVSPDEVIRKMMQADAQRRSGMTGYTAVRRYSATNSKRHAEMVVQLFCDNNGAKRFTVISEQGSGAIRKHVFDKMLSEESEASKHESRESTRLVPANYDFLLTGKETLDTGPAYVFEVTPKTANKYLIVGKIWVDANDYSIVRVEGQPARSLSFWIRSIHFTHTYQKVGQFWLASSTHSVSDIRIFGTSELTIEDSSYQLNAPDASPSNDPRRSTPGRTQQAVFSAAKGESRVSY